MFMVEPFSVKDCALAVISTGISAASIVEFKGAITHIPTSSLYYHFWKRHFWHSFVYPEFHNDFAEWAYHYLHDPILSERLGIIDPNEYSSLDELRNEMLEIIEQRIDEMEYIQWSTRENKFHFLRSEIIVFDTMSIIETPAKLITVLPQLTSTSIFYHFIDARRRTPNKMDDFSNWLKDFGPEYEVLLKKIQHIDPYFLSLKEQRERLTQIIGAHIK